MQLSGLERTSLCNIGGVEMEDFIGLIAVVMVFSIPITAILTNHFRKQTKLKHNFIKDQIRLEELKQEKYLHETEKLKLELNKLETELSKDVPEIKIK